MTADPGTTDIPARPGAHELVLLHGQPGSPADWQLVTRRLPAQLHAVAADRPGYGSSQLPAGGFAANAHAVLDDLDSRGVKRAVLVGHSYGGGVALWAASLAPHRVEAVVLLASVGPGCVNRWDRLLAAPGAGPLCALTAWRLTPWLARARLARIGRRHGRPLRPDGAKQRPDAEDRSYDDQLHDVVRDRAAVQRPYGAGRADAAPIGDAVGLQGGHGQEWDDDDRGGPAAAAHGRGGCRDPAA